jgi:hypothetical protein
MSSSFSNPERAANDLGEFYHLPATIVRGLAKELVSLQVVYDARGHLDLQSSSEIVSWLKTLDVQVVSRIVLKTVFGALTSLCRLR